MRELVSRDVIATSLRARDSVFSLVYWVQLGDFLLFLVNSQPLLPHKLLLNVTRFFPRLFPHLKCLKNVLHYRAC